MTAPDEVEIVAKAALFKPRIPEELLDVPGLGSIRIRGLTRIEVILVGEVEGTAAQERRMLRYGMVAPKVSEAEAERWQKASPGGTAGELEIITRRIGQLSAMTQKAPKEAYASFRGESGDGVRALPSDEAEPDGGGAAPDLDQ